MSTETGEGKLTKELFVKAMEEMKKNDKNYWRIHCAYWDIIGKYEWSWRKKGYIPSLREMRDAIEHATMAAIETEARENAKP